MGLGSVREALEYPVHPPPRRDTFVSIVAEAELLADTWADLPAPEPLRTVSDIHEVCFTVSEPAGLADRPMGVLDAAGDPVYVTVEVASTDDRLPLSSVSYNGPKEICFGSQDSVGVRTFDLVRLRASATINVSGVEWHSTAEY